MLTRLPSPPFAMLLLHGHQHAMLAEGEWLDCSCPPPTDGSPRVKVLAKCVETVKHELESHPEFETSRTRDCHIERIESVDPELTQEVRGERFAMPPGHRAPDNVRLQL